MAESARERRLLLRLREAQEREAALVAAAVRAIDALDDMRLSAFDREQRAAALLERAIGRTPRAEVAS